MQKSLIAFFITVIISLSPSLQAVNIGSQKFQGNLFWAAAGITGIGAALTYAGIRQYKKVQKDNEKLELIRKFYGDTSPNSTVMKEQRRRIGSLSLFVGGPRERYLLKRFAGKEGMLSSEVKPSEAKNFSGQSAGKVSVLERRGSGERRPTLQVSGLESNHANQFMDFICHNEWQVCQPGVVEKRKKIAKRWATFGGVLTAAGIAGFFISKTK